MSILKELNPQKNDVVRIKFKTINTIVEESNRSYCDTEEYYTISSNIKAYLQGGDFLVTDSVKEDMIGGNTTHYIEVQNHIDKNYNFDINDEVIESIEIIDDAQKFISHDHGIIVVIVGDEMFINGKPLIWDEEQRIEKDRRRGYGKEDQYENPNRKLLKMFENYIADLAVRDSFSNIDEGDEL